MPGPVIRIFSDLHFRDGESRLQHLDALAPLLEGADQLVFNGDTVDSQDPAPGGGFPEVQAFFARYSDHVTFLTGNHDPDISPHAELSLNNGRVWITHGDVLFDGIAPWSELRPIMAARIQANAHGIPPGELALIETRLRLNRLACIGLVESHSRSRRTPAAIAIRLAHELISPSRIFAMLKVWRTTPQLARRLARAQRPAAQLVVLGHTHYPGVWRHTDGPVVVNTGSFSRPLGNLFVELRGDHVRVIKITRRHGKFHPGRLVTEFPLAP
ncbi:metallophosphoesterase family protein [Rariglobus hedericola]|uniref:Calcineurin-like phosphoesterase domain-containing protein n=1 Tax=Rariglobus hedericola TaxID=2597822 RepID=A0A556QQV3_9BACT|nr:metallophosphoesterase family protein [Rariglobus hedericola]TSJ79010.1 hypothetical protein FPL22_06840 [Rariglobus hedericola]